LKSVDILKEAIGRQRATLIVVKPLTESQNVLDLLARVEGARALWIYRHYRDVACSNLTHFGAQNGISNLRPIVAGDPGNWRSEHILNRVRQIVRGRFSEDMNPHDAAALFWYARNSLFFDLALNAHPAVSICRYEDFVAQPGAVLRRVYAFLGRRFPGETMTVEVRRDALGKGKSIQFSPDVEQLCQDLLARLDAVYVAQRGS